MAKMNQRIAVMKHLVKHGSITSKEAFEEYGATRLSAIIFSLRHQYGWDIDTANETGKNRYGNPVTYARYVLK